MLSENQSTLTTSDGVKQLDEARKLAPVKKARFLAAWKRGINLVGVNYFDIKGDLETATDKNQLCPNYEMIDASLHQMSKGQATFIAAMYSFYNDRDGQKLLESLERPNICDLAAYLEDEYTAIIAELFLNYGGW